MDSSSIPQAIQTALEHYQAGRAPQAEAIFQQILDVEPNHPDALHFLGVIAFQGGRKEVAAELIGKAISVKPTSLMCYNLGLVLRAQGKLDEAVASYRRALALEPDYAAAHFNLGNVLQKQGKLDEAVASYRSVIALKPDWADAHNNLGIVLQEQGKLDEAVASSRRAIALKPDFINAYNSLGIALQKQGKLDDAAANYRRAITLKPDYADAHKNLGSVFQEQGQMDKAMESYRHALSIKPGYADAYLSLAEMLKNQGYLDEALANFKLALNVIGDWKESLQRLTTPTVITTGMVLDSHKATSPAYSCKQVNQLAGTSGAPVTPAAPLPSLQEKTTDSAPGARKNLRIILIYPPPWQIPLPGETPSGMPFGPTRDTSDHHFSGDFCTITYGLQTIAAEAKHAGYEVSIYNLSICPWQDVVTLIAENKADVYGISAFVANRRGMGAISALVRQQHPQAHITVGGPFVTALPQDTLRHYRDIDTAVIGEGEETFMELLECLENGKPTVGIPGTAWRNGEDIVFGPVRQRIKNLDALTSPFDYFTNYIVMTSRGCPSKCTFCGSITTWGRMLRFQSAESCIDTFKKALARLPVPFIAVKDDTFTAHRRRAIAICDSIIESKMNFMWSCDTRVDSLDEELLRKMRLAGCQTISLGVESGSPEILKNMRKEITPEMILEATHAARKYGMDIRYYMILINRGETPETIQQSNDLIKAGRPDRFFFSPLTYIPGTEDWAILREKQGLTPDIFFNNDFWELGVALGRHKEVQDVMLHVMCDIGAIYGFDYTVDEREAVIDRLPDLHSAHVELANAYFRAGRLDDAASALNRAEELGFPIGNVIYNQRGCIALARGEVSDALALLECASQSYPNRLIMRNLESLRAWAEAPANYRGKPPILNDSIRAMDFKFEQLPSAHPTAM